MPRVMDWVRDAWRDQRGVAALELAVAAPLLILLLFAIIDFGRAIDQNIRLETAARSGAQYALSFPEDLIGITAAVNAALTGQAGLHAPEVSIACECPVAGGTAIADAGCTSSCAGRQRLVTISVQQDFTAFQFAHITRLTGNVTLRLE